MKTQRRKAAYAQSEELNFAPSRLGVAALNTPGNARASEATDAPSLEIEGVDELPCGWEVRQLGELIARPQYGLTASAIDDPNGPRFLRITDIQESGVDWTTVPSCDCDKATFERAKLLPGDLVVARIGATTGKAHLIRDRVNAVFASYLIRLRASDGLEPEFLNWFTNSSVYWRQIDAVKGGRLKQGVNIPLLEALQLILPPLPEQQAIASALRTVQEAKEACERVLTATRQLKQSLLHHLFTYGPVSLAQAAKVPLMETAAGEMPEHWQAVPLGDICDVRNGFAFEADDYVGEGVLNFRIVNIKADGRLDIRSDAKFLPASFAEQFADYLLNPEDVLLVMVGATRGKLAFITPGVLPALMNQNMWRVVSRNARVPQRYLYFYLLHTVPVFAKKYSEEARGFFSKEHFRKFPVAFPSDPSELADIAAHLSAVDAKVAAGESRRAALAVLFQSLLHHLMTGKVRLPDFAGTAKIAARKE